MKGRRLKCNLYEDSDLLDLEFEIKPFEQQLDFCFYCNSKEICLASYFLSACENFPDGPPPLSWQETHSLAHEMRKQFEY